MADDERRRAVLAEIGPLDSAAAAGDVMNAVCRFTVDRLKLSGCALMLRSHESTLDVLATAGPRAEQVAELQFALGEGPCLDAAISGEAVFAVDLETQSARWPVFSTAAVELGVRAEFSLPLQVGLVGLGTLDLSRAEPGMLDDESLALALTAADIATDALLLLQSSSGGADLSRILEPAGADRLVVHQATGMISVQLDGSTADAMASLRAAAFRSGRSIHAVATDVVERRMTFRD
jgi:hypothetical protein